MNTLLLIAATALSIQVAKTNVTDSPAFQTREEAAKAALTIANDLSQGIEFGGAIIKQDGAFYYTTPVTSNDYSRIEFIVLKKHDSEIVALYHIHPKTVITDHGDGDDNNSTEFSEDDIKMASKLNVASYIYVQVDNTTRAFIPGVTKCHIRKNTATGINEQLSIGEIL